MKVYEHKTTIRSSGILDSVPRVKDEMQLGKTFIFHGKKHFCVDNAEMKDFINNAHLTSIRPGQAVDTRKPWVRTKCFKDTVSQRKNATISHMLIRANQRSESKWGWSRLIWTNSHNKEKQFSSS